MIMYMLTTIPIKNANVPHNPKKCMEAFYQTCFYKHNRSQVEKTLMKRSQPNLQCHICARDAHHFFANFKPCPFCQYGYIAMHFAIHFILFTTFFLYDFSPQLKSCSFIFDMPGNGVKKFRGNIFGKR